MKRAATVALTGFLMLSLGAGIAQAEPYSDPATTPGKIVVHPKPQPGLQPSVEATVYAQPYGIVPDFHSSHNFSPFGTQKNVRIRGYLGQPNRYSLFFKTRAACQADLDPYGHDYGALNPIVPQHWVWIAKNDATQQISTQCYRIYNGMWVYEYNNFFEMPVVQNPQNLPGHYPKNVPAEQKKYLRK